MGSSCILIADFQNFHTQLKYEVSKRLKCIADYEICTHDSVVFVAVSRFWCFCNRGHLKTSSPTTHNTAPQTGCADTFNDEHKVQISPTIKQYGSFNTPVIQKTPHRTKPKKETTQITTDVTDNTAIHSKVFNIKDFRLLNNSTSSQHRHHHRLIASTSSFHLDYLLILHFEKRSFNFS